MVGCAPTIDLQEPGMAPTATILTPAEGTELAQGAVALLGRVSDPQDPAERLFATWSIGPEGADADATWRQACVGFAEVDGTTRCAAELRPEDVAVRLSVVDIAGFVGVARVPISVRALEAPSVTLVAPTLDRFYYTHLPIEVAAEVVDPDGPDDALLVSWSTDRLGPIDGPSRVEVGRVSGAVRLPVGEHELVVRVEDADAATASDRLRLVVLPEDDDPLCRIDLPEPPLAVVPGSVVQAEGVVLDDETDGPQMDVIWSWNGVPIPGDGADIHGYTEVRVDVGQDLGTHVLSLSGDDQLGHTCEASIEIVVDLPPILTWTAPTDTVTGPQVTWALTVDDPGADPSGVTVQASSDLAGVLWTLSPQPDGALAVAGSLAAGSHELTVVASDPLGLRTTQQQTVVVTP
jgi:hypothetical protein